MEYRSKSFRKKKGKKGKQLRDGMINRGKQIKSRGHSKHDEVIIQLKNRLKIT